MASPRAESTDSASPYYSTTHTCNIQRHAKMKSQMEEKILDSVSIKFIFHSQHSVGAKIMSQIEGD
jgi:hypothetical protein